jgi:hypothetical protein
MRRVVLLVVAITFAPALAHVAPSVDDNNRYLKVTPQSDRVRLAYTVFFGEVPGRAARPSIDTNKDGALDDAEAQAFGDRLAADVIGAMDVAVDGKSLRPRWKTVSVGLGSPTVVAGAFSVDMIAYVCVAHPRGNHAVLIRDRFRVPRPGETEVVVEDGPGVRIEHARMGQATAIDNVFKLAGPGGPLSDDGLDVAWTADDKAPLSGECEAAPAAEDSSGGVPWLWIGLGAALLAGGGFAVYSLRK